MGSYFYAINSAEVLVNGARLINTAVVFFNLVILLWNRKQNLSYAIHAITIILLMQSFSVMKEIYEKVNAGYGFDWMVMELKGNAGNKNIMAAILAIKFSFALYTANQSNKFLKVIGFLTLLCSIFSIFIINSRTTFISIFGVAILYLSFLIVNFIKDRQSRKTQLISVLLIVVPITIALYFAQGLIVNIKNATNDTTGTYGTVFERIKTIYVEATSGSGNTRIGFGVMQ
jgi:hypothetical protein